MSDLLSNNPGYSRQLIDYLRYINAFIKLSRQSEEELKGRFDADDEKCCLAKISGYIFGSNKYNCISYAKRVADFLSHKSGCVRNFAAMFRTKRILRS